LNGLKKILFTGVKLKRKNTRITNKKYNVENLWRVELTNFWRMIHTIKGNDVEVICFILEICNHEKYNKLFGYKGK